MATLMRWTVVLAALSASSLLAQDISGTWQGKMNRGRELRIVVKVSKAEGTGLNAVMYSIDQNGQGLPAGSITLQGSALKMTFPGIGGSYEGKLDAGGKSITGTWTEGSGPTALNLQRATNETAWVIPDPPTRLKPMAADAVPVFEVATIKPSKPGEPGGKGVTVRGRQLSTFNTSVSDLITFTYGIHARQIMSGPAWLESEKYDIVAKPDGEGQPSENQWRTMLQKLLSDRFHLGFHRDKKELSVYAIVVGKSGPKLTQSAADPNGLPSLGFRGLGGMSAKNANMNDFAGFMQTTVLDRPVLNQSGLSGRFDFTLNWTPDEFQFAGLGAKVTPPVQNAAAPPDLFTAIQVQLGLRLESTKASAEIFVVDHVEKPSEN